MFCWKFTHNLSHRSGKFECTSALNKLQIREEWVLFRPPALIKLLGATSLAPKSGTSPRRVWFQSTLRIEEGLSSLSEIRDRSSLLPLPLELDPDQGSRRPRPSLAANDLSVPKCSVTRTEVKPLYHVLRLPFNKILGNDALCFKCTKNFRFSFANAFTGNRRELRR